MGLVWSKRKRIGKRTTLNLSKSGASVSRKAGPLSLNSRGRGSIRLGKGLSFRFKLF
jgi:hypothetical protein